MTSLFSKEALVAAFVAICTIFILVEILGNILAVIF